MLKKLFLAIIILDSFIVNFFKRLFPHRYKLGGQCKKCGRCCEEIGVTVHPRLMQAKYPVMLSIKYYEWLYGFKLRWIEPQKLMLVFRCKHAGEDGKCKNYFWRPPICRNYPIVTYFEKPATYPWCGYRAEVTEGYGKLR